MVKPIDLSYIKEGHKHEEVMMRLLSCNPYGKDSSLSLLI